MEKSLNDIETIAAKSIIDRGLEKAAQALSFFMKEEIKSSGLNLNLKKVDDSLALCNKPGENFNLLTSHVIGELKGVCCLIFSETESAKLCEATISSDPSYGSNLQEIGDALLLEVDNIITASVITEFSNLLNLKIYGGVPQLKKVNEVELNSFVKETFQKDLFIINFKTQFVSSIINFSPEFIWVLDKAFLDSIRKFAAEPANMSKIELEVK